MKKVSFDKHVFCCTNKRPDGHKRGCCADKKSIQLRAYMKKRTKELIDGQQIRINTSGCLDQCEYGPVMVIYPDNVWYAYNNEGDIDRIIDNHLRSGKIVADLILKKPE
jgi:(2Fe-2S) ferredoxin|tara:strand:- start:7843 stop:8169 length:327 start_codon:yes stop_codon:yes gene_type:complete